MLSENRPNEQELEAIGRQLGNVMLYMGEGEPLTEVSVPAVRRFAAAQKDPVIGAQVWGLGQALFRCKEELEDLRSGSFYIRESLANFIRARLRQRAGIPIGVANEFTAQFQRPFAVPHPRVLVLRCHPLIRIARPLWMLGLKAPIIALYTDPSLEDSPQFRRALEHGRNQRQARSEAFTAARHAVNTRQKSNKGDEFYVRADTASEGTGIFKQFARENGYPELAADPASLTGVPFLVQGSLVYFGRPTACPDPIK